MNTAFLEVAMMSIIFVWPKPIFKFIEKWLLWRQQVYDKVLINLLNNKFAHKIIIYLHTFLFYFRYISLQFGDYITKYMPLSTFAVLTSIVLSRLQLAGYLIIFTLFFLRLDSATILMLKFYKRHPTIFQKNFPLAINPQTRGMWGSAKRIAEEAASNPHVQTVAIAVVGAVAWKALDIYDRSIEHAISQEQIVAEAEQNQKNRLAEAEQNQKNRLAEAEQQEKNRLAEAEQQEKNRLEENKRTAFDKLVSSEYNNLNEIQQQQIKEVVSSGTFK